MKRSCLVCLLQFSMTSFLWSQLSQVPNLPTPIQGARRLHPATLLHRQAAADRGAFMGVIGQVHRANGKHEDPIFLAAPTFDSNGGFARSVATGDLNGDGKDDVVVANEFGDPNSVNGSLGVMLGQGDGKFAATVTYAYIGQQASSVKIADVNGDGKPDILVSVPCATAPSCSTSAVDVLLGNGDGTFEPAVAYSVGQFDSQSLAVADVNGDGKLDLVVTFFCTNNCAGDGGAAVLLGNGDGTFRAPVDYDSGGYGTQSLAVADVNGDGKIDVVVDFACTDSQNCVTGGTNVLLGNGDGTFRAPVSIESGFQPGFIVAADVNGDHIPDLLLGNGGVAVLLGNGNGTFQAPVNYSTGALFASALAVADINRDGKPDLLVSSECISDGACQIANGSVSVLLGKGNGTFKAAQPYGSGGADAVSVAVGDASGDYKPFVAVANECINATSCNDGSVAILLSDRQGTLSGAAVDGSGEYGAQSVKLADVNGDGKLDLVIANECASSTDCNTGSVSVLLGKGNGTFGAATTYDSGGFFATDVAVGDVNGDGKQDLVVANECESSSPCGFGAGDVTVDVLLGNGNGTFKPAVSYIVGATGIPAIHSVALADLNHDGKLDLVVGNCSSSAVNCANGGLAVMLGSGNGTFQSAVNYSTGGTGGSFVVVADVNKDGKLDLVAANQCNSTIGCSPTSTGGVGVLLGNGDGTFKPATTYSSGGFDAASVAIGDLNQDGKLDIVAGNQCASVPFCANEANGSVGVLLGNGDGTFRQGVVVITPGQNSGPLAVADFNGDKRLDVASGAGNVLLLGKGDGTFGSPLPLGAFGPGIAKGDLNHDGKQDLVVGGATVLLNVSGSFL